MSTFVPIIPEIALLAYARYAQDKYDWVNQRRTKGTAAPTEEEVAQWIGELPNSRLSEIHAGAINMFREAAETYMDTRIQEERTKAVEGSILNRVDAMAKRVERATSWRATWIPNVFAGIVASLLFTVFVLVRAAIYRRDPSPFALFKEDPALTKPVHP